MNMARCGPQSPASQVPQAFMPSDAAWWALAQDSSRGARWDRSADSRRPWPSGPLKSGVEFTVDRLPEAPQCLLKLADVWCQVSATVNLVQCGVGLRLQLLHDRSHI